MNLYLEAFQVQAEPCVPQISLHSLAEAMHKMTKPQLEAELLKYHEHPAPGWTKVEIRQRLLELQGRDREQTQKELTSTTLQRVTREMRKASKTKATLVKYCEEELNLTLTGNETKPQLEMKAMNKIMAITPGEAMDVAGLAAWLEPRLAMESLTESRTKGYKTSGATSSWMTAPKTAPKPLLRPRKSEAAGSTTSSPEVVDDQTKKMDEMAAMIHQLQEELSSLRPEPPRKQQAQADEESMTDRSFVNVTPRAQK